MNGNLIGTLSRIRLMTDEDSIEMSIASTYLSCGADEVVFKVKTYRYFETEVNVNRVELVLHSDTEGDIVIGVITSPFTLEASHFYWLNFTFECPGGRQFVDMVYDVFWALEHPDDAYMVVPSVVEIYDTSKDEYYDIDNIIEHKFICYGGDYLPPCRYIIRFRDDSNESYTTDYIDIFGKDWYYITWIDVVLTKESDDVLDIIMDILIEGEVYSG